MAVRGLGIAGVAGRLGGHPGTLRATLTASVVNNRGTFAITCVPDHAIKESDMLTPKKRDNLAHLQEQMSEIETVLRRLAGAPRSC